jgi:hypothetical protein
MLPTPFYLDDPGFFNVSRPQFHSKETEFIKRICLTRLLGKLDFTGQGSKMAER